MTFYVRQSLVMSRHLQPGNVLPVRMPMEDTATNLHAPILHLEILGDSLQESNLSRLHSKWCLNQQEGHLLTDMETEITVKKI